MLPAAWTGGEATATFIRRRDAPCIEVACKGVHMNAIPAVFHVTYKQLVLQVQRYLADQEGLPLHQVRGACSQWDVTLWFECHQIRADRKRKFVFKAGPLQADLKQEWLLDFAEEAGGPWPFDRRNEQRRARPVVSPLLYISLAQLDTPVLRHTLANLHHSMFCGRPLLQLCMFIDIGNVFSLKQLNYKLVAARVLIPHQKSKLISGGLSVLSLKWLCPQRCLDGGRMFGCVLS